MFWKKSFTPDALPAEILAIYPGLGSPSGYTGICPNGWIGRELQFVVVDLEKTYHRVPREELWYCMRKSEMAEKYVRFIQDMYERKRNSGEVCSMNYRKFQGQGRIAPGISVRSVSVCCDYG